MSCSVPWSSLLRARYIRGRDNAGAVELVVVLLVAAVVVLVAAWVMSRRVQADLDRAGRSGRKKKRSRMVVIIVRMQISGMLWEVEVVPVIKIMLLVVMVQVVVVVGIEEKEEEGIDR